MFPFHAVGDIKHHHHAMATSALKLSQNLQHTIPGDYRTLPHPVCQIVPRFFVPHQRRWEGDQDQDAREKIDPRHQTCRRPMATAPDNLTGDS
jgi:hypothetical protein